MKTKYTIVIYWSDEDDAFIAEVPELPGCMADGATYQGALANAEIIIQEWIATARELGRPIPEPCEQAARGWGALVELQPVTL
jgi:predicted RNase H-like HicB family nuclease